jgi:hypothetical protein
MEKKSFMENAKGFLSSWKDSFGKKNEDILDRKKKREEEAEAMKQEMLKTFDEIKIDLEGKSKDIAEVVTREFAGFSDALKRGTASVKEKLELEKHLDQLKFFLKDTEKAGAKKFGELVDTVKTKLSEFDTTEAANNEMKNEAESNISTEENLDDLTNDAGKLSDELDDKVKD